MGAFSDGVFAVLITILVLELKPPTAHSFSALFPLWPTGLSYVVSYLFIAIVWVNHHHLLSFAGETTPRLVWSNFAHLFSVSLIPITTEWIADSRLAGPPVTLYASVFVLVNITYVALCFEVVDRPANEDVPQRMRRLMRMRSFITIAAFVSAAVVALWWPVVAMVLICLCLIWYLRPGIPAPKNAAP
ncbi:DUF1211 domain-containing membrane protein [Mycobacterium alsense]|uniref:DUF1211 domain-containing membrane protein n=1 Tax=Mycobacterium alsense TaxID=324058 RepID=A0AA42BWN2_9MYCO|nr:DUF1211 domain-containing protein [Mycobacterium alsense]OQZ92976.1 DUF1211 domain-containing membrane protein [Mycobacterium alsense]